MRFSGQPADEPLPTGWPARRLGRPGGHSEAAKQKQVALWKYTHALPCAVPSETARETCARKRFCLAPQKSHRDKMGGKNTMESERLHCDRLHAAQAPLVRDKGRKEH